MILDDRSEICSPIGLAGLGLGANMFGDAFDLAHTGRQLTGLYVMATCTETATSSGAATATLSLVSAADGSFTNPTVHGSTGAIALASIQSGRTMMCMPLPAGPFGKYLGVRLTVGGAVFTAGKLAIALVNDPAAWQAYKKA